MPATVNVETNIEYEYLEYEYGYVCFDLVC